MSSSDHFYSSGRGGSDDDNLSQVSGLNNNNTYSTAHSNASNASVNTEILQFRNQLRSIHGRMQQTAALGESLVSTEHEIQLYMASLKGNNPSASSLQDAFDEQQVKKSQELQEKIKALTKRSDDLVAESTSIGPQGISDSLVSFNYPSKLNEKKHLRAPAVI